MTNKGIARQIKKILPWWECDGDIYRQTMEILESKDKKLLKDLHEFIKDYHNAEKVAEEIQKKIENLNKPRYYVIEDLQNTDFAMNRYYTIEQWQKQALEWCYMDDNEELAKIIYKLPHNQILNFIAELWAIRFKKCRKDKNNYKKNDIEDFEDETLRQYYNRRF